MMERTQRVAKLEALLARVQSRAATSNGAHATAATTSAPVVARTALPTPSPKAPHVEAAPPHASPEQTLSAADDAPTAIHSVDVHAIESAAAAAEAVAQSAATAAAAPPPAAAPAPAPAFRGVSALGALSKKATLIGTAPPANWPPRGAETSVVTEAPKPPPEAVAAPPAPEAAPELAATEADAGDVDALMGGAAEETKETAAKPGLFQEIELAPATAATRSAVDEDVAPIIEKKAPPRSASPVLAFIVIWLILLAGIWFAYKHSI